MFRASAFPGRLAVRVQDPLEEEFVPLARDMLVNRLEMLEQERARVLIPQVLGRMCVFRSQRGLFHLYPELFIQIGGYTDFQFPREKMRICGGDIGIVPRGMAHVETAGDDHLPFYNRVVMFFPDTIHFHFAHAINHQPLGFKGKHFLFHRPRRIWSYLDDAGEVFHGGSSRKMAAVKGLLAAHLAGLIDVLEGHTPEVHTGSHKIAMCRHFVQERLTDSRLSVKLLAEWVKCAPDYLSHLFHKETGQSLKNHINKERLEHAKILLEDSALNVSEIAMASGYDDPSYFTRLFRKGTGQTPKQYRALSKGLHTLG